MKSSRVLILFIALLISVNAYSEIIDIIPPTEREDGTPLTAVEIAGYKIYDGSKTLVFPDLVIATTVTVPDGAIGPFYTTTVDTDGRESNFAEAKSAPKPGISTVRP